MEGNQDRHGYDKNHTVVTQLTVSFKKNFRFTKRFNITIYISNIVLYSTSKSRSISKPKATYRLF